MKTTVNIESDKGKLRLAVRENGKGLNALLKRIRLLAQAVQL
jgi:hypothetical protein